MKQLLDNVEYASEEGVLNVIKLFKHQDPDVREGTGFAMGAFDVLPRLLVSRPDLITDAVVRELQVLARDNDERVRSAAQTTLDRTNTILIHHLLQTKKRAAIPAAIKVILALTFVALLLWIAFTLLGGSKLLDSRQAPVIASDTFSKISAANISQLTALPVVQLNKNVTKVAFSPNGKLLAIISGDYHEATVRLWDIAAGEIVLTIPVSGDVTGVSFSPDGKFLTTWGGNDIDLWAASTGKLLKSLAGHTKEVSMAVFSPDSQFIASASKDGTARVWSVTTGNTVSEIKVPQSSWGSPEVLSIVFSPDGNILATGNDSGLIHLWNPTSGQQLQQMTTDGSINVVLFSPNGKLLAASNKTSTVGKDTVQLWDLNGQKIREMHTKNGILGFALAFSPDGTILASVARDYNAGVEFWDVATGKNLGQIDSSWAPKNSITFSPDGRLFVIGSVLGMGGDAQSLTIWATK
jgi:WD40 repeat protein